MEINRDYLLEIVKNVYQKDDKVSVWWNVEESAGHLEI